MAYNRYHKVETRIVRIFNTFGPRMRIYDGRVVPTLMRQAIQNEDLTVYGDGSQTRSFCYVSDLIEGIYRLMMSDHSEPVNIGSTQEMSIQKFAELILEFSHCSSRIVYEPLPQDDPKVRRPDIAKAKKLLDWEPKVNIEEGLRRTMEWMQQVIKA